MGSAPVDAKWCLYSLAAVRINALGICSIRPKQVVEEAVLLRGWAACAQPIDSWGARGPLQHICSLGGFPAIPVFDESFKLEGRTSHSAGAVNRN